MLRKFRLLALLGGLTLLAWLVERAGPARLLADLLYVGWWMLALLAIAALRNAFRAAAVSMALAEDRRHFSFASMYVVLMVSEAVKFVAVAGFIFGETTKGWLLNRRVSGPRAVSTVMVDVLLYYLTAAVFSLAGVGLFFASYSASGRVRWAGTVGAAILAGGILLGAIAFRRHWLRASRIVGLLARAGLVRHKETVERVVVQFELCSREFLRVIATLMVYSLSMRVFWHNGALQLLPESKRERCLLAELALT